MREAVHEQVLTSAHLVLLARQGDHGVVRHHFSHDTGRNDGGG